MFNKDNKLANNLFWLINKLASSHKV